MNRLLSMIAAAVAIASPAQASTRESPYIAIGQTATVDGLRITPLEVLSDSRCPVNARCIWAGELRVSVRVNDHGRKQTVELVQGKPAKLAWGDLSLIDALPQPYAGRKKMPPYRLKFSVERHPYVLVKAL